MDLKPRVRKDKRKIKPAEDHALPPKSHLRPKYKDKKKEAPIPTSTQTGFDINFGFDNEHEILESCSEGEFESGFPVQDYDDEIPEDVLYNAASKYVNNDEEESKEDEEMDTGSTSASKRYMLLYTTY